MATYNIYLVFILPIALSFVVGSAVLAQILNEPDRELDLWQFDSTVSSKSIKIRGLDALYSTTELVSVKIFVSDNTFDCGDLYITIRHSNTKEVVTQSGFFNQCFAIDNSTLPINDEFSEVIAEPGNYEIRVDVYDKSQKDMISFKDKFRIK